VSQPRGTVTAPGVWPSSISALQVAAGRLRLTDLQLDGEDAYWIEGRPTEAGRCVIVRERDGVTTDLIAAPFSARTGVHEYGGAAMRVHDGTVHFSNASDRRLYRITSGQPQPLTGSVGDVRYADLEIDGPRDRIVCVAEDHRGPAVVNDIRVIPLTGGEAVTIVAGNDFYSTPRVSPDGRSLAWLTWHFPNMPWDGCELWVAAFDDTGVPQHPRLVAGGPHESIFQPSWSADSVLHFSSDRTGWWNIYRCTDGDVVPLAPMDAECGGPQWVFGLSTYAHCGNGSIALWASRDGEWECHLLDAGGNLAPLDSPYAQFGQYVSANGDELLYLAGGPDTPMGVVREHLETRERRVLRLDSGAMTFDPAMTSTPRHVTFPGEGGAASHAWFYAPRNDTIKAEPGRKPPLLVRAHGGPTSATSCSLDATVQYWTSRGFAYLDVDYGGSTGYGRPYRERLNGQGGIVDVGDCVAGAQHFADTGVVDPGRLFIHGGSAGGYVVLCAMAFHDVFQAGASLFGIADVEVLFEQDPHKFESHYESPYPHGRARHDRSPVHFIDRVRGAVLLLQGLDDPVVPPQQAELMFAALQAGGVPCAYIGFAGEQHGFRKAETIARSLEAELYFFATVTDTPIAEAIEPVEILNFPQP
jgi:dipeptidyl aminopeptidase/acylaminoacyl peptidase